MKDMINRLKNNKYSYLVLIGLIGVLILTLSFSNNAPKNNESRINDDFDAKYIQELEIRIENILSTINGAGECEVMINTISTTESVYVKENKKSSDDSSFESEDSILTMTDGQGNQYAVLTKKILPQISGVIVTCKGGKNIKVKAEVTQAVCTVLGIGSNNVCVIAKS